MDIVVGTGNPGKIEAFRRLLAHRPVRLHSPEDLGLDLEVEETGATFEENAVLKARAYRAASGMAAISDDSGLCIDALKGAPGLCSARFGGPHHTPRDQNLLVLRLMRDVPRRSRGADFVSIIAFAGRDGQEWTVEGRVRGEITYELRGSGGFGYDPIFLAPEVKKTFAEMTGAEKDPLSHRGIALQKAGYRLEKHVGLLE